MCSSAGSDLSFRCAEVAELSWLGRMVLPRFRRCLTSVYWFFNRVTTRHFTEMEHKEKYFSADILVLHSVLMSSRPVELTVNGFYFSVIEMICGRVNVSEEVLFYSEQLLHMASFR